MFFFIFGLLSSAPSFFQFIVMATFHQGLTPRSWDYSQGCRRPPGSIKFWRIDDALDVLNHNGVQTTKNVFQKCDQLLCSSYEKKVKKIYPLVNHGHPHLHNNHSPNHKPKQKNIFIWMGFAQSSILNSKPILELFIFSSATGPNINTKNTLPFLVFWDLRNAKFSFDFFLY